MPSSSSDAALVDAHCHIDLFPSPADLVTKIDRAKVHTIAVTNAPFVFQNTLNLSKLSEYVHPALGLHPELVHSHGDQLEQLVSLLPHTRFIGEVGLDFVTQDRSLRQRQADVFNRILAECRLSQDKVITVHSRRAAREVIAAVGPEYPGTIILHWYSGSLSDLRKAVSYGLWFSVNVAMTKSKNGMAIIAELPRDRVLTETDGPFVKHGGVPQQPIDVKAILPTLANVWKVDEAEARSIVLRNFASATQ